MGEAPPSALERGAWRVSRGPGQGRPPGDHPGEPPQPRIPPLPGGPGAPGVSAEGSASARRLLAAPLSDNLSFVCFLKSGRPEFLPDSVGFTQEGGAPTPPPLTSGPAAGGMAGSSRRPAARSPATRARRAGAGRGGQSRAPCPRATPQPRRRAPGGFHGGKCRKGKEESNRQSFQRHTGQPSLDPSHSTSLHLSPSSYI